MLVLAMDAFGGRGGIAAVTRDVVQAMSASTKIERVHILPRRAPDELGKIPKRVCQSKPKLGRISYSVRGLVTAIQLQPSIIYCNHLYMAPLAAILSKIFRARLIIHLHGIEIWEQPTRARRKALEAADLLLCVSRDTRAKALNLADVHPERAVVLNNTVGREFTPGNRAAAREKFALTDELVLVTVGRLASSERYKGHERVIMALPKVIQGHRKLIYVIAGEGDDRSRLEGLATNAGVQEHVRFIGHLNPKDLPDFYRAADIFVMPSSGEGFGIVFLEAMASGTQVVGLAYGGAADLIGYEEFGQAPPDMSFERALVRAISRPAPDPIVLSNAVLSRFGQDNFIARAKALLETPFPA